MLSQITDNIRNFIKITGGFVGKIFAFPKNIRSILKRSYQRPQDTNNIDTFQKIKKYRTIPLFVLLFALGVFGAYFTIFGSTVSRTKPFTFQGRLLSNDYIPSTDGNYNMKFRIYDAETNGTCKWGTGTDTNANNCTTPGTISVTIARGFFTATLGDGTTGNPVFPYDFTDPNTYLNIQVETSSGSGIYETLTPRVRLTATPYALNAQEVAGYALSGNISGTPTLNGSYLSLGAGTFTDSDTAGGMAVGNVVMHSFSQKALTATNTSIITTNTYTLYLAGAPLSGTNETITNAVALGVGSASLAGGGVVTNSYGLYVSAQTGATTGNYAGVFMGGNVGMGTTTPAYTLDVATSSAGVLPVARLQNTLAATTSTGAELLFAANRTTSGMTNVAGISGIITDITDGAYRGALALYTASSTEPAERMRIDYLGNVGIGTASPITQFHVPGRVPIAATTSLRTGIGEGTSSVYVQGRYAYITNNQASTATNRFQIIDISNLGVSAPTLISSTSTLGNRPHKVVVQGRYAYITMWDSGTGGQGRLQVFDISNPTAPTSTGSYLIGSESPMELFVSGNYAYVTDSISNTLYIINISNPSAPSLSGSVVTASGPMGISIQGRYAYITANFANKLEVVDISNPASPSITTSFSLSGASSAPKAIAVQGQHAYITKQGSTKLEIVNISNPASPSSISSSFTIGLDTRGIVVHGRYAYLSSFGDPNTNGTLRVIDISSPTSPILVGSVLNTADNAYPLFISGRYAIISLFHVDSPFTGGIEIFDLGGSYIQQLETGGLEVASADIRTNLSVNNGLTVFGGMNVGMGGIYSAGSLAISTTHANALPISPFGTSSGNTGEMRFLELSANGSNYVGFKAPDSITTSTAWVLPSADGTNGQALSTNGSGILSWATVGGSSDPWTSVSGGIYYAGGKIGIGATSTPTALLTLTGGGIMMDSVPLRGKWNSRVPLTNTINTLADTGSNNTGEYSSTITAPDGNPVIAYYDYGFRIIKCNEPTCASNTMTIIHTGSSSDGYSPSIAIGADGYPVVVYRYNATDINVLKCGDPTCATATNTISSAITTTGNTIFNTSITIGSDGFPIISVSDYVGNVLKVIKCGDAACSVGSATVTNISLTSGGIYTSIAIAIDGNPIIAIRDANSDLAVIKCGNLACSSGNTTTALDNIASYYSAGSLIIPPDGLPIISYHDGDNEDLKIFKCGNFDCSTSGNDVKTTIDSTTDTRDQSSMTLGTNGNPIIAYYGIGNGDLRITTCGNASCSSGNITTVIDSSIGAVWYGDMVSITTSSGGLPLISYYDPTPKSLKFVKCANQHCLDYWTRR